LNVFVCTCALALLLRSKLLNSKTGERADLERLCGERDDLAVQVSLAWENGAPDLERLEELGKRLRALEAEIELNRRSTVQAHSSALQS
jgi:hypothetical protein